MKEHPLCIINVYMLSDNSNHDEQYKDILSQLEEIIDKFQCQYKFCCVATSMRPFIETIDRETNAYNSSWRAMA